jgi:hypothetical protein
MKRKELKIDKSAMAHVAEDAEVLRDTHPPVFLGKRLQAIENKGWGSEKERQEISRVGNLLRS